MHQALVGSKTYFAFYTVQSFFSKSQQVGIEVEFYHCHTKCTISVACSTGNSLSTQVRLSALYQCAAIVSRPLLNGLGSQKYAHEAGQN